MVFGAGSTDGSATTCLTCNSTAYLLSSLCYTSCPVGYYPSTPICSSCMSNCLTCANYSSC